MKYYVNYRVIKRGKASELKTKLVESTEKLTMHIWLFDDDPDFVLESIIPAK